jgi:hypothetical protein
MFVIALFQIWLKLALASMASMSVPEAIELSVYQANAAPDNCVYRTLAVLLPRCLTPPPPRPGPFFFNAAGSGSNNENDEMNLVLTDTERVYYAVGLSLCQLIASRAAVPASCPAALKLTVPINHKDNPSSSGSNSRSMEKCLAALHASPQLWATYNGYYQAVGRICVEQAPLHQRERLLNAYTRVVAAHEQAAAELHAAMARSAEEVWALVQAQAAERIGSLVAGLAREATRVRHELEAVGEQARRLRVAHAHVAADQNHVAHELGALAGQLRNLTDYALNASNAITASTATAAAKRRYTTSGYGDGILDLVVTVLVWAMRAVLPSPPLLVVVAAAVAAMRSSTVMMIVLVILVTYYTSSRSSSSTYNTLDRLGYLGRMGVILVAITRLARALTWGSRGTSYQQQPQQQLNLLGPGHIPDDANATAAAAAGLSQPAPKIRQEAATMAMLLQPFTTTTATAVTPQQVYNRKLCRIYRAIC